jgi:predicted DNA-binding transcriptional regulator
MNSLNFIQQAILSLVQKHPSIHIDQLGPELKIDQRWIYENVHMLIKNGYIEISEEDWLTPTYKEDGDVTFVKK